MVRRESQLNVGNIEVTGSHLIFIILSSMLMTKRGEIIFPLFTFIVEVGCLLLEATIQAGCQKMGYSLGKSYKNRLLEGMPLRELER